MGRRKKSEIIENEAVDPVIEESAAEITEEIKEKPKTKKPKKYEGQYEVHTSSWLNIRKEPTKASQIIGKLTDGTIVSCKGDYKKDDAGNVWLLIEEAEDHGAGYCMVDFLVKQ